MTISGSGIRERRGRWCVIPFTDDLQNAITNAGRELQTVGKLLEVDGLHGGERGCGARVVTRALHDASGGVECERTRESGGEGRNEILKRGWGWVGLTYSRELRGN